MFLGGEFLKKGRGIGGKWLKQGILQNPSQAGIEHAKARES